MSKVIIGLEVHVQLNTATKLFCGCSTTGEEPNTRTCDICLGFPGSKPVLNKRALDFAIKLCLALNCTLSPSVIFSRKTYFYPDLAKNFQITQYEEPLGRFGSLKVGGREIEIQRAHIEEDPAALVHEGSITSSEFTLVDYNRSGIPLCEIVTAPVIQNPREAREFLKELIKIINYLGIFDSALCTIKADANISIAGGQRIEVKNISGFKEIERALNYEMIRQRNVLRTGAAIIQQTRAWDPISRTTKLLRKKETEEDYGYITEPDLPAVDVTEELVSMLKKEIPELARQKAKRFVEQYNIDPVDSEVISSELELAELFELVAVAVSPDLAARWLRRELLRVLNYNKKNLREVKISEGHIIELLSLVETNRISETTAQKMMEKLIEKPFSPLEYVEENGLLQISEENELREICLRILKENSQAIADFREGKLEAFSFLVGQVMKATRGTAHPHMVNKILKEEMK